VNEPLRTTPHFPKMAGRYPSTIVMALLASASAISPSLKKSQALSSDASSEHGGTVKSGMTAATALVQQHLTVCNAYPAGSGPLEIFHVDRHVMLTQHKPLKYKECQEFTLPLMSGDRLDFKVAGANVGTFHATSMPKVSASLLLIPRRKEGERNSSRALAFESHAFADLKSPQIAVVDAYHGNSSSSVNIIENMEDVQSGDTPLTEALRFNSVVAVAPGKYNIALLNMEQKGNLTATPLRAGNRAKCVIMRVGGTPQPGEVAFPQELVVFPNSASGLWKWGLRLVIALLLAKAQ